ncbi:hypothetical protein CXQ80_13155 [Pseudomonas sp. 02C 26]|uniref:hypothetical protein n=1 Tax=Pseudomonas sp. 02C 26 TaxID=2054914 RepID=UPI000C6E54BC|nr:hypothetical protein [Pseudomonas sp. 02C 26]AUF96715.1 hypothetical protein CXQ80_13155 [Pseudomonas sp. 02C 26]
MEQMITDNPAARTLRVLKEIDEMHGTNDAKKAWGQALGVDSTDEGTLLIRLGQFIAMPAEAVELMNQKFPALKSQATTWHHKLMSALTRQSLSSQISTFTTNYSGSANNFLEVMDQMLALSSPPQLDQSVIADFQNTLEDLINDVKSRDLELKVKEYLVKSLRRIVSSLDDYYFSGVVPVMESIEIVAGHMFTDSQFKESLPSDLGNKLFSVLGAVADGISIATGAPPSLWNQLGQSIQALLPQGN